jgi:hypothetical protein
MSEGSKNISNRYGSSRVRLKQRFSSESEFILMTESWYSSIVSSSSYCSIAARCFIRLPRRFFKFCSRRLSFSSRSVSVSLASTKEKSNSAHENLQTSPHQGRRVAFRLAAPVFQSRPRDLEPSSMPRQLSLRSAELASGLDRFSSW